MGASRAQTRVDLTGTELTRLCTEIELWLEDHADFEQYSSQVAALDACLHAILAALQGALKNLPGSGTVGAVYGACHDIETKTTWARQVWRFYADKFDQREDRDTDSGAAVLAADEVVWSCFGGVYKSLPNVKRPAPPLPHLEPLYSPYALPRDRSTALRNRVVSAPFMQQFLAKLPIPTLALSESCSRAPWWLIYIGHEVGHHLQHDLLADGDLVTKFQDCLRVAVADAIAAGAGAPPGAADKWAAWGEEIFADAASVYSLGPRAAWAIAELVMGDDEAMLKEVEDRYPPAAVRLALMAQLPVAPAGSPDLALADVDLAALTATPAATPAIKPGQNLRAAVAGHLALVPAVAQAIDAWDCGGLGRLRTLCRWQENYFKPGGDVDKWCDQLLSANPLALKPSIDATRLILSGGLGAWDRIASTAGEKERAERADTLKQRLCQAINGSREGGKRTAQAAPPAKSQEALSADLAQQLLALPAEELGL